MEISDFAVQNIRVDKITGNFYEIADQAKKITDPPDELIRPHFDNNHHFLQNNLRKSFTLPETNPRAVKPRRNGIGEATGDEE